MRHLPPAVLYLAFVLQEAGDVLGQLDFLLVLAHNPHKLLETAGLDRNGTLSQHRYLLDFILELQ